MSLRMSEGPLLVQSLWKRAWMSLKHYKQNNLCSSSTPPGITPKASNAESSGASCIFVFIVVLFAMCVVNQPRSLSTTEWVKNETFARLLVMLESCSKHSCLYLCFEVCFLFFSSSFGIQGFTLRSLAHFEMRLCKRGR